MQHASNPSLLEERSRIAKQARPTGGGWTAKTDEIPTRIVGSRPAPARRSASGTILGLGIGTAFGWSIVEALEDERLDTFAVPIRQLAVVTVMPLCWRRRGYPPRPPSVRASTFWERSPPSK